MNYVLMTSCLLQSRSKCTSNFDWSLGHPCRAVRTSHRCALSGCTAKKHRTTRCFW